jgi:signal peptidase I
VTRNGRPDRLRSVSRRAASFVLTVLSLAGVLCIALVIAGYAFGTSLILFSTGSMAPTIPAGSVALVREVPATQIEVGDVVTVDRPGELPITHRVTEVLATDGDAVTFTMQGDANDDPDLEPYTATSVREVLGSVPRLANLVAGLQDARVLGALAVGAAALVTWAFWPRDEEDEQRAHRDSTGGESSSPSESAAAPPPPAPDAPTTVTTAPSGEVAAVTADLRRRDLGSRR